MQEFSDTQHIPYPLLSDVDSRVIRQYGILNDQVSPDDAFIYGIPYPGIFVCDEDGVVVSKFFHDSYKKRESPEALIDAALGRIQIDDDTPRVAGGTDDVRITAFIRGGRGSLRQGIIRHLVIRFELAEGLHIYGDPVPDGLTATHVTLTGPEDLRTLPTQYPSSTPLHLSALDVNLNVWSGQVDIVVPFYPAGDLATESRRPALTEADLQVDVAYQACDDTTCLLPRTESLQLKLPTEVVDVPNLSIHRGHGQREGNYDSTPAMRRLIWRKVRGNPLRLVKFIWRSMRLQRASRKQTKRRD